MSNEKYEKGLQIRTQVLGEAYVNRSIENADDFTRPCRKWSPNTAGVMSGAARVCRSRSAA
jgi:hypothetical protein